MKIRVAVWGDQQRNEIAKSALHDYGYEAKYFVDDNSSNESVDDMRIISSRELQHIYMSNEIDGVLITFPSLFCKMYVRKCSLYSIGNIGVLRDYHRKANHWREIFWLDTQKDYMPYLETHVIDSCNLNCTGCSHFATLFTDNDVYDYEMYRRDVKRLSECFNIMTFRLMGGEPLKKKRLGDYILLARDFLPKTDIRIVTNGLLIPSLSDSLLRLMNECKVVMDISLYPPTEKILDSIEQILNNFQISYYTKDINSMFSALYTKGNQDPYKAMSACKGDTCRHLRNGKIYKCGDDILRHKYSELANLLNLPEATGVDIYGENVSTLVDLLDEPVNSCFYCAENPRDFVWECGKKPNVSDWLAF